MKLLVVGRSGQLAQALRAHASAPITFLGSADHDFLDVDETRALLNRERFGALINTAAYTKVDQAEKNPDIAFRMNEDLPRILALACRDSETHLIHISTDYVFRGDRPVGQVYDVSDSTDPINRYGESKLAGERAVLQVLPDALIVRTSWLMSRFGANFITKMTDLMLSRERVSVVDDQWGTPTLAGHLAASLLDRIVPDISTLSGVMHVSGGESTTWHQVAAHVRATLQLVKKPVAFLNPIPASEFPTPARRGFNTALRSAYPADMSLEAQIHEDVWATLTT